MPQPKVAINKEGINQNARLDAFKLAYGIVAHRPKFDLFFKKPISITTIGDGLIKDNEFESSHPIDTSLKRQGFGTEDVSYRALFNLVHALMDNVIEKASLASPQKQAALRAQSTLNTYLTRIESEDKHQNPHNALINFANKLSGYPGIKTTDRFYTHIDFLIDVCEQELALSKQNQILQGLKHFKDDIAAPKKAHDSYTTLPK